WDVGATADATSWLVVDCDGTGAPSSAPRLVALARGSLHELDPAAAGFHALAPLDACRLVELTSTPRTPPETLRRADELVASIGRHAERVGDAAGLVLGRIVCQLINEAAFLIGEGNGTPEDVDAGMEL